MSKKKELTREDVLAAMAVMVESDGVWWPGRLCTGNFAGNSFMEHGNFNHVVTTNCEWYDFDEQKVFRASTHDVRLMTVEQFVKYQHLFTK